MLLTLLVPVLLQSTAAAPPSSWVGDFTLTITGSGKIQEPLSNGRTMSVTWKVDRVATGRIVLDRSFKGAGIAGASNSRDTLRYESWIANTRQPLTMQVRDSGTYAGPAGSPRNIALDVARYTCPAKDAPERPGQVRSAILQFDRELGSYAFEAPRLFSRCETSYLRTPTSGPPEWMARAPFDLAAGPIELEFEMVHKLVPLESWRLMTGPLPPDARELVLSRRFTFQWMHPLSAGTAPVQAELQLVLRRAP